MLHAHTKNVDINTIKYHSPPCVWAAVMVSTQEGRDNSCPANPPTYLLIGQSPKWLRNTKRAAAKQCLRSIRSQHDLRNSAVTFRLEQKQFDPLQTDYVITHVE